MLVTNLDLSRSKLMASVHQVFQMLCLNCYGHFQQEQLKISIATYTYPTSTFLFVPTENVGANTVSDLFLISVQKIPSRTQAQCLFFPYRADPLPLQYGVILINNHFQSSPRYP